MQSNCVEILQTSIIKIIHLEVIKINFNLKTIHSAKEEKTSKLRMTSTSSLK